MSETQTRAKVVQLLNSHHAVAVENPACPGTPDVAYIGGWIELKQFDRWPINCDDSPFLVEHYTVQQRQWHVAHRVKNGTCWMGIEVGREFILMDAGVAAIHLGLLTRKQLLELKWTFHWDHFNKEEIRECILQTQSDYWSTAEGGLSLRRRLLQTLKSL